MNIDSLIFSGYWIKEEPQKFSDLYFLVHNGIPDTLRIKVWKELLKAKVHEFEEIQAFKHSFPGKFKKHETVYQNYKAISESYDCLAFE
jgi:hypothetical protein